MFGNRAQMGGLAGPTGYSGGGQQMQYKAPTTPLGGQPSRLPTMPQRPQLPQQAAPQAQANAMPANWGDLFNQKLGNLNFAGRSPWGHWGGGFMAGQMGTWGGPSQITGRRDIPFSQMALMALGGRR